MATEKIDSPHKRVERMKRTLQVLQTWAEFDLQNKPTIPRALIPHDVARMCAAALRDVAE